MSKMTDRKCQDCTNYDSCEKDGSTGCDNYEYYKCRSCRNRDDEAKCIRGGKPCSQITFCQIGGK